MTGPTRLAGLVLVLATAVLPLRAAAPIRIKLATQAPTGTIWEKELRNLGSQLSKATTGGVVVDVYADGSAGSESSTVTKMTAGTIQASLLTAGGLSDIDKAFNVFTIPFFFATDAEEQAVQTKLEPLLEQALNQKGFHFLCWGTGGWIQIFSKKPLKTLAEVKASNIYVSNDDAELQQWYTDNGFHPKPLTIGDIATQLKLPSGQIDTAPNTPYLALLTQIYGNAKYMLNVHLAPLVGALIVTTDRWKQLSPDDQKRLTDLARAMEQKIRADSPTEDASSITAMKTRGLVVIDPDDKAAADFRNQANDLARSMRGKMVPANVFDLAAQERDAVRKASASGSR
jgi:TRAP-type C4-dicarboxylate transport system substrate-binding protein